MMPPVGEVMGVIKDDRAHQHSIITIVSNCLQMLLNDFKPDSTTSVSIYLEWTVVNGTYIQGVNNCRWLSVQLATHCSTHGNSIVCKQLSQIISFTCLASSKNRLHPGCIRAVGSWCNLAASTLPDLAPSCDSGLSLPKTLCDARCKRT